MAISKTPTGNKTPSSVLATGGQKLGYQRDVPAAGAPDPKGRSAPMHTPPPIQTRKGFTGEPPK